MCLVLFLSTNISQSLTFSWIHDKCIPLFQVEKDFSDRWFNLKNSPKKFVSGLIFQNLYFILKNSSNMRNLFIVWWNQALLISKLFMGFIHMQSIYFKSTFSRLTSYFLPNINILGIWVIFILFRYLINYLIKY